MKTTLTKYQQRDFRNCFKTRPFLQFVLKAHLAGDGRVQRTDLVDTIQSATGYRKDFIENNLTEISEL